MIGVFRTVFRLLCAFLLVLIGFSVFSSTNNNTGTIVKELLNSIFKWSSIKTSRRDTSSIRDERKKTEALMIVSYMRSGSTFTADIFQQSPEVFYIYEPFKPLHGYYFKSNKICHGSSEKCRFNTFKVQKTFNDILNTLTCNFHRLRRVVLSALPGSASQRQTAFKQCLLNNSGEFCVKKLNGECRQGIPTVKTIRLSLDFVMNLFNKLPGLKIVHLLRDPRAVIYSRLRGGYVDQGIPSLIRNVCERMLEDMKKAKLIKEKYPGQLMTFFYEDIAEEPIKSLKSLYDFAKLKLNSRIEDYVYNITRSKKDGGYFSTNRADSKKVANMWRKRLKWLYVREIDRYCSGFYKASGYLKITSKSNLRNLKIKSFNNTI